MYLKNYARYQRVSNRSDSFSTGFWWEFDHLPAWSCIPCLQIFIRWSKYNLLMLNMVLHTLFIHLIVHSESNAQSGQVFALMLYFGKHTYHFRHIVEMFWATIYGAPVPRVWALQNRWEPCTLWHSSRKPNSRMRFARATIHNGNW